MPNPITLVVTLAKAASQNQPPYTLYNIFLILKTSFLPNTSFPIILAAMPARAAPQNQLSYTLYNIP